MGLFYLNLDLYTSNYRITDGQVVRTGISGHEMYCHDLEVMSSKPCQVELGVHGISVDVVLDPKI